MEGEDARQREERLRMLQLEDLGISRFKAIAEDDFPRKRGPRMSLAQLEANRLCNIQGTKEYEQAQSVKGLLTKWAAFGSAAGNDGDGFDDIAAGQTHRLTGLVDTDGGHGFTERYRDDGFRGGRGRGGRGSRGGRGGGVIGTRGRGGGSRSFDRASSYDVEEKHTVPASRRSDNSGDKAFLDSLDQEPHILPTATRRGPTPEPRKFAAGPSHEPKKALAVPSLEKELRDQDRERNLKRLQDKQEKMKAQEAAPDPNAALISKWQQFKPKPALVQQLKAPNFNQSQGKKESIAAQPAKVEPMAVQVVKMEATSATLIKKEADPAQSIKEEPTLSDKAKGKQIVRQEIKSEHVAMPKVKPEPVETSQVTFSKIEEATPSVDPSAGLPTPAEETNTANPIVEPPSWDDYMYEPNELEIATPLVNAGAPVLEFSGDSFEKNKSQDDLLSPATLISFDDAEEEHMHGIINGIHYYNQDLAGLEVDTPIDERREEGETMEGVQYSTDQKGEGVQTPSKATAEDLEVLTKTLAKFDMDLGVFVDALPKSAAAVIINLIEKDPELSARFSGQLKLQSKTQLAQIAEEADGATKPSNASHGVPESEKRKQQKGNGEYWTVEAAWNKIMYGGLEASIHAVPGYKFTSVRSTTQEDSNYYAPSSSTTQAPLGDRRAGAGNYKENHPAAKAYRGPSVPKSTYSFESDATLGQNAEPTDSRKSLQDQFATLDISTQQAADPESSIGKSSVMNSMWATREDHVQPPHSDWTRGQRRKDPLFREYNKSDKKHHMPSWLVERLHVDAQKDKAEGKEKVSAVFKQYDRSHEL